MIDDAKDNCHRKVFLCLIKAVKQFIDLCNQIGSTCTPRRNISQTTAVKFLYARKFDVPRAVSLYEQHEQIRLKEGLYNIDPDIEPLRSELQTGKFTILPARDSSGAAIALFTANRHSPLSVTHTTTLQGIVYQLDCALQDTETQKAGLVFIYDMSGSKYSNFDYDLSQKILTLLKFHISKCHISMNMSVLPTTTAPTTTTSHDLSVVVVVVVSQPARQPGIH
uniref:CRAL/TRIO N-terminal domain-containing protein n=1 Tax=Musca domestica TaxID=7370 RepID=A0A1I8NIW2_MUSDO